MTNDDAVLIESMPPMIPRVLRASMRPAARQVIAFLARKYDTKTRDAGQYTRTFTDVLVAIRDALGKKSYLLDAFTYADVTCAVVLQFVAPVADRYIKLGPASRAVWTDASLRERFADLVEWRDALYARHRRPS